MWEQGDDGSWHCTASWKVRFLSLVIYPSPATVTKVPSQIITGLCFHSFHGQSSAAASVCFFYRISLLNRHGVMSLAKSLCLQAAQRWRSFKDTVPSALVIAALPTGSIASKVTLHFLNSRLTCGCQALLHDNDMQVWTYHSFTFCKQGHSVCDCENGLAVISDRIPV